MDDLCYEVVLDQTARNVGKVQSTNVGVRSTCMIGAAHIQQMT